MNWTGILGLCFLLSQEVAGGSDGAVMTMPPTTSSAPPIVGKASSGGNPATQLLGYVRDSVIRMKDGSVELYTNHKQCNEIRTKQKTYFAAVQATLSEEQKKKMGKRITPSTGGITYEEFDFLQKGKDDRSKLGNIAFMMFAAPNFLPYAFMFFPDMLPGPFKKTTNKMGLQFSKWEMISRERSHAVIKAFVDLERDARVPPAIANINPFGKAKTKRNMERIERFGQAAAAVLVTKGAVGDAGANVALNLLQDQIYATADQLTKKELFLADIPKNIMMGLCRALDAPTAPSSFLPNFVIRGRVLAEIKKMTNSDEFLVNQKVDLNTIRSDLLVEACTARLISAPGRTDEEMRASLANWLEMAVVQPASYAQKTGLQYNANLVRTVLLSYHAIDAARDSRASSYLPRLMFQGQL
uniref:Letm1 RBD domain-containing protein n=1 Tax=Eucampia antarctica TaxID=49252 RepID=A0A7S2R1P5_9STRA|mmetsp:Transcript_13613/g.13189  ORF Transcript_13613/g.13189 Transcript_13613/m.13189 type:complete len:413 (+) Transcript_13613:154-1392(+)|eukprot:CAMPEP_0197828010 /NCGR_PEP_ID=MMETSP1437-20131217/4666_1 /TAXON_ID=49252 ORGANISM="Eucampia antarctica, Strain CCMP1452" /NCGR_SAMPLE_ID=MMETSP1437 /ASSEMBLY_ACC=CAM_ASM_001096 /LENGTH=412 /DNA_ID=CAMNT_0043429075 /DNA_START=134 /DNA_END=1372 /DNA_ORIENTATION=+